MMRWRILLLTVVLIFQMAGMEPALAGKPKLRIAMLLWRGETDAERGFRDGMQALGYAAVYDVYNAEQQKSRVGTILRQKVSAKKHDYVYTFGTTVSLQTKGYLNGKIPHIFNIVADPVGAGLANSLESSGGNLSGVKSGVPLRQQIENAYQLLGFRQLAYIFNSREKNSNLLLDTLNGIARDLNFEVIKLRSPPVQNRLAMNLGKIRDGQIRVDAVYLPSDSYIVSNAKSIALSLKASRVPSIGAIGKYMSEGILMGSVADYYELGKLAASIVHAHRQGRDLSAIPIQTPAAPKLVINSKTMELLKLDLPNQLLSKSILVSK